MNILCLSLSKAMSICLALPGKPCGSERSKYGVTEILFSIMLLKQRPLRLPNRTPCACEKAPGFKAGSGGISESPAMVSKAAFSGATATEGTAGSAKSSTCNEKLNKESDMSERVNDPTFQDYGLGGNNGSGGFLTSAANAGQTAPTPVGGQSYNIAQDAEQALGPVTFTPRDLADLDNKMNAGWWARQGQQPIRQSTGERGSDPTFNASPTAQQGATPGASSQPGQPTTTQSIGERTSDPSFNNVAEGEKVAEQVRRGYQRADFARGQTVEGQREKWANKPNWYSRNYPKCNEFVYEAHFSGDPHGGGYPTVLRDNRYYKPTVDILADPNFSTDNLEYHPNKDNVWPGDIVVWYDGDNNHHSGIALGNGQVAYASKHGAKVNTIDGATELLGNTPPIIRRYK